MSDKLLNTKDVKGHFTILKVVPYRGCETYIRKINDDIFEYILIFDNQIYSSYIVVTMEGDQKELTEPQILDATGLIFAAACTTIDQLIEMRENQLGSNPILSKNN